MAKENDINLHVRLKGTDQTKQGLDETADGLKKVGAAAEQSSQKARDANGRFTRSNKEAAESAEQLGQKSEEAGQKAQHAGDKTEKAGHKAQHAGKAGAEGFEALATKMALYAAGAVGVEKAISAITRAIEMQTEAMAQNAKTAMDQQNALLRLQFLGDFFAERPELRKDVAAKAEYGRRPFEEVAGAWYSLRSKNAALPQDQRDAILNEALEMGRTDPTLPLDTLVDMFSLYAKKSGTTDANRVQNVLQQTITEAGGSSADVATYMPRFLPIGMAGGLSGAETAGLWAYATTQEGEASVATTGLRALFMGLEGKGTPEGAKLLKKFGVDPNTDFFTKMQTLSAAKASGQLGLAEAEQIAQREGASMMLSMLDDPEGMMRTIDSVVGVDRSDVDLTKTKIDKLFGSDPMAQAEDQLRLRDVQIENVRGSDKKSVDVEQYVKANELKLRTMGAPEAVIAYQTRAIRTLAAMGMSPENAYVLGSNSAQILNAINPSPGVSGFDRMRGVDAALQVHHDWNNEPLIEVDYDIANEMEARGADWGESFRSLQGDRSQPAPVINNVYNNNVNYHIPEPAAQPRVSPDQVENL